MFFAVVGILTFSCIAGSRWERRERLLIEIIHTTEIPDITVEVSENDTTECCDIPVTTRPNLCN
jgi:hypothetical protein